MLIISGITAIPWEKRSTQKIIEWLQIFIPFIYSIQSFVSLGMAMTKPDINSSVRTTLSKTISSIRSSIQRARTSKKQISKKKNQHQSTLMPHHLHVEKKAMDPTNAEETGHNFGASYNVEQEENVDTLDADETQKHVEASNSFRGVCSSVRSTIKPIILSENEWDQDDNYESINENHEGKASGSDFKNDTSNCQSKSISNIQMKDSDHESNSKDSIST